MALALPDWPWPATMTPRLITGRAEIRTAWGGLGPRLNRGASRYAFDISLPIMTYQDAQDWAAIDDEEATVTLQIIQPGLDTGAPGLPKVKGAAQAGSSLLIDGLTPHYVIRRRQFLSITTGGRLYLYRAKAEVVADAAGEATVTLETMLRVSPADNDVVELAAPRIEGYPMPASGTWQTSTAGHVALSFGIEERG